MTQVCKKTLITEEGKVVGITFGFANGKVHEVRAGEFPLDVQEAALVHGFSQKLGDAYSGAKGDADMAEGLFLGQLEALRSGWNRGERGQGGQADADLAAALAELTKRPLEEALRRVAEEGKEWKADRRKRKDVQAIIKRIQAERAEAKAEGMEEANVEDLL